ncbi:MAG TPA: integrase domain-containing protein [Mariprofundaceae bacterium]|nr:integrase domain-containing protein [Mariprofundaceae bacterium]
MSRNYGWKSRDMFSAAMMSIRHGVYHKEFSYSSYGTLCYRFRKFVSFLQDNGINRLESISPDCVIRYGKGLADLVMHEQIQSCYAQCLVSAINTVLSKASSGQWESISPTRDCEIPKRSSVRRCPTCALSIICEGIEKIRMSGLHRQAYIAELCIFLGLRVKEASLIDCVSSYNELLGDGIISITKGSKGGRPRKLEEINPDQVEIIKKAAEFQGSGDSLIPENMNWKKWNNNELSKGRKVLRYLNIYGYRELRSAYAAEKYFSITNQPAPCNGGRIVDKDLDKHARQVIAKELGHGRIDVVSSYIGGRR